jgi:uncharacterized phage protein (TIGR02218 family)
MDVLRATRVRPKWEVGAGVTYDAQEQSRHGGAPIEHFKFSQGATTWRWTSADVADSIADPSTSHEYSPTYISRGAQDFSQESSSGNLEVRVARDNPIAVLFRAYVPPTPVELTIYRRHRADAERIIAWVGKVVSVVFEEADAVLTCAPISQVFKRLIPILTYQPQCPLALYGVACGVNKDDFKDECTLSDVDGVTLTSADFDAQPDGWFTNGWVERANGERRFVVNHVGAVITVVAPFSADLAAAEVVDAYAGCDRSEATCAAKFGNLDNHLGFARIPTKNPHGGGAIY